MKKSIVHIPVRRGLLVLALSAVVLFFALAVGFSLTQQKPPVHPSTPALTATKQAGPYTIALSLAPNPPSTLQFSHLILRVTDRSTGQPVTDAGVEIRGVMSNMEMSMGPLYADVQQDGSYAVDTRLSMNGPWQLQVTITRPNVTSSSTQFEITAITPL